MSVYRRASPIHTLCGFSSFGRAPPCQGGGGGFEPRNPLQIRSLSTGAFVLRRHSQVVRPRSAKPLSSGPNPDVASKCSGLKRCRSKNPRFSRVFFVFLRFPRFFKIRLKAKTKRCQIPISTFLPESDWRTTISGRFSESFFSPKTALFSFSSKK